LDVIAHQRESEAGPSSRAPVVGGLTSKESVEDLVSFVERDTFTVVVDVHRELIVLDGDTHRDRTGGVAVRVVDEVRDDAFEPATIHAYEGITHVIADFDGWLDQSVSVCARTY
jgi:hypothetical protein